MAISSNQAKKIAHMQAPIVYYEGQASSPVTGSGFDQLGKTEGSLADFLDSGREAGCFILNTQDNQEAESLLRLIRTHSSYCLKLVLTLHPHGQIVATLADGQVLSAADAITMYNRFLRQASAVLDQPEPQHRETRLLRYLYMRPDYVLTPVKNWQHRQIYHFPLVECLSLEDPYNTGWLANLRGRGLLQPVTLIDRMRGCPRCKEAHVSFIDVCPNCQGFKISEEIFLHCFTCGNVERQAKFLRADGMHCPRCYTNLRHIGVDYDRALENFCCQSCQQLFHDPDIRARCHICDWSGTSEQLIEQRVESLQLTEAGRLAASSGHTESVMAVLDSLQQVNVPYFRHMTDWCINLAQRHPEARFSLLCIKIVNIHALIEQIGSNRVMLMLDGLAGRLREIRQATDIVTRSSEACFWLLLPHTDAKGCQVVLNRILETQKLTRQTNGPELFIQGSYFTGPDDIQSGETAELLMARLQSGIA